MSCQWKVNEKNPEEADLEKNFFETRLSYIHGGIHDTQYIDINSHQKPRREKSIRFDTIKNVNNLKDNEGKKDRCAGRSVCARKALKFESELRNETTLVQRTRGSKTGRLRSRIRPVLRATTVSALKVKPNIISSRANVNVKVDRNDIGEGDNTEIDHLIANCKSKG